MTEVPFYKMVPVILNSLPPEKLNAINQKPINILKQKPVITFENYVKSNLFTDISIVMDRDSVDYLRAYKYLNNKQPKYRESYEIVRDYFFLDIGKSVCSMLKQSEIDSADEYKEVSMLDNSVIPEEFSIEDIEDDLRLILSGDFDVRDIKCPIDYAKILIEYRLTDLKQTKVLAETILYLHCAGKEDK